jgi:hypothetical protein
MSAPRDIILSITVPNTGDGVTDLQAFKRCWNALHAKNPTVLRETRCVLCISLRPCFLKEAITAEIEASWLADDIPIHHVCDASWGQCFNDAFLFAVSCDRAKYWLHVDEEHVCSRPFWNSAAAVLKGPGAHLWQLQITEDWDDLPEDRLLERDGFTQVVPHPDEHAKKALNPDKYVDEEPYLSLWPVFSLRPCVFLLEHFRTATTRGLSLRPFDEVAAWAPLQWRFGLKLEGLGAKKGLLTPTAFRPAESSEMEGDFSN